MTSLSVLVPAYDEQHLVAASLARLEVLAESPHLERIQVVVVDDSSRDGTAESLRAFAEQRGIRLAAALPAMPRPSTPGAGDAGPLRSGRTEERRGAPGAGGSGRTDRGGPPHPDPLPPPSGDETDLGGGGSGDRPRPRGIDPTGVPCVERGRGVCGKIEWVFLQHVANGGKGTAVRTALAHATGAISIIHDADLEYHPKDILRIVKVFEEEGADAVFGSRFAGGEARRALLYRHELGNRFLTFLTNLVTNVNLTDMETCYKAVRTDLLRSIPIRSNDFRLEPELTIKLAKREARIFEVPISYSGRTYQEGKKIGWVDGLKALLAILRFWLSDDVYVADEHGSQILGRLARAPRFNAWMADTIRPYCGDRVLEIGSGTGNLTRCLVPRTQYVASDVNPLYLQTLRGLTQDRPYLDVTLTDVTQGESFPEVEGGFDTVVCLNVVEHVADDRAALANIRRVLAPGGRAIVLVPQGPGLMGTLDEVLGHHRRYTEAQLRAVAAEAGLEVREVLRFNRVGTPAWWLNGRLLRRREFGLLQIVALNLLTPLFRRIDRWLPFPALSLIAIMVPAEPASLAASPLDRPKPEDQARLGR